MKRFIALGAGVVGGVLVFRLLSPVRRRISAGVSHWMLKRMEHMMASLPRNAPPKLIMSILPRLRDQNDEIIAMLREQNELLRKRPHTPRGSAPDEP